MVVKITNIDGNKHIAYRFFRRKTRKKNIPLYDFHCECRIILAFFLLLPIACLCAIIVSIFNISAHKYGVVCKPHIVIGDRASNQIPNNNNYEKIATTTKRCSYTEMVCVCVEEQ